MEILRVEVELDGQVYSEAAADPPWEVGPGQTFSRTFPMKPPALMGSYAQRATVFYLNDARPFSLSGVGYVHFDGPALLETDVLLRDAKIRHEGNLELVGKDAPDWKLVLPDELRILEDSFDGATRAVRLRANRPGYVTTYPVYAFRTSTFGNLHSTSILSAQLQVDDSPAAFRGRIGNTVLLVILLCAGAVFFAVWESRPEATKLSQTALGKYAARVFWLSAGYLLLKNADSFFHHAAVWAQDIRILKWDISSLAPFLSTRPENPIAQLLFILRDNLRGDNYTYFFQWFIDPYFAACALLCFFYSRYLDQDKSLRDDKYGASLALLLFCPTNPGVGMGYTTASKPPFLPPAKLGFLAIGVKIFFLPYLTSWVINNILHQWNLTKSLSLTFAAINGYLLALFLLVDSAIFAFGYAMESRHLKSDLRSVEPTFLGWLVCLWCYPPFNSFSFRIFDYPIFGIHVGLPSSAEPFALAAITVCWGIFAWASVALGFKASNLTNRGIVSHGPYRWCRHPAYAAKMLAWTIEAIFFGQYFTGLLIGFLIIYSLRAWTEERHLSRDPDYLTYKNRVKYWFIPCVI